MHQYIAGAGVLAFKCCSQFFKTWFKQRVKCKLYFHNNFRDVAKNVKKESNTSYGLNGETQENTQKHVSVVTVQ